MKPFRLQFGLFDLLFIPSMVVATNWLLLTWTRTDAWTYFIQRSPGVVEEETSTVRLMGWPIPYNVAFPSESFGARNFHWIPFVVDCVVASLVALAVYWLYRCVMKRRSFDSAQGVLDRGSSLDSEKEIGNPDVQMLAPSPRLVHFEM